ncbi:MAG: type II toxin-antitoxin system VapC family toxin [Dyadobacter fermentans]
MRYLLDTHTLIWFIEGNRLVSNTARTLIEDKANEIYISMASLWEIAIKTSLRKLTLTNPYESLLDDLQKLSVILLPINFSHTVFLNTLPHYHKDPFDRMIASQAICEHLDLLSCDDKFDKYHSASSQKRLW